jgi:hypothetical protein
MLARVWRRGTKKNEREWTEILNACDLASAWRDGYKEMSVCVACTKMGR